jgi:hypothetical protein
LALTGWLRGVVSRGHASLGCRRAAYRRRAEGAATPGASSKLMISC